MAPTEEIYGDEKSEQMDLEASKAAHERELGLIILRCSVNICYILVSCAPLWILYKCVQEVAGKKTDINVGIVLTISAAGIAALVKLIKNAGTIRTQQAEILRLEKRCRDLEQRLLK